MAKCSERGATIADDLDSRGCCGARLIILVPEELVRPVFGQLHDL